MSTQKRFEIGVDYEGVSARHLQVNEEIIFSNEEASRIFMPECGSFYVDSLDIKDNATGKDLVPGIDFDVFILDVKATKKSGKQVCGLIVVKNESVRGVIINYRFVGGIHSSGYYILEQLLKMYPEGNNAIISYDDVLNKPDEFDPAYHNQHVGELFKTESLLVWLERIRQGIHHRQSQSLIKMYDQAQAAFDNLYSRLNSANNQLTAEIEQVLQSISIQGDEYILTDSAENPAVRRGYGDWEMITNTILRGGPAGNFLVGTGSLIAMGSEQVIRNCYIWYNKKDTTVNKAKVVLTSNKDFLNEGETITFTLNTTNIPNATKLEWFLEGIDDKDILNNSAGMGTVTVNNGVASVTLTAANDRKTEGSETFIFRLRDFPQISKNFTVLDTSVDRRITSLSFMNTSNQKIETVGEDAKFKLRIVTTGLIGQTVHLRWSASASHISTAVPSSVVITANTQDIPLENVGDLTPNATHIVEVHALEASNEVIDATTPKAVLYILDTSQELLANIVFLNSTNLIVTNIDEDTQFKIKVRTNGGIGQKLKFAYRSNRPLSEFEGLAAEATIGSNNSAEISARNIANYLTATETEFLEVTVSSALDNKVLATSTLLLNDTTKNPNFLVSASANAEGNTAISTVDEGDDFYLVFKVPGWVGAVTPPSLDILLDFTGGPSLAQRITIPTKLTGVRFDDKNNNDRIQWLNGDTLALRLTAIADKAIHGNANLKVRWKMSLATVYNTGPSIDIIDTSKPTLSASWSSSATELTPITQVNEMQTSGLDNTCYLFLDVDGDGSTFTNLKLELDNSVAVPADLIQVYPRALTIAKGLNRHVVRVDILADFITEGNERLSVKVTADGFSTPLVTATIVVVDNSVRIPITYTRSASTIYSGNNYSEWENVTVTINLQPLAFATTLVLTATGSTDMVTGLTPGSYNIPANQSSYTITMAAKKVRHETGNYSVGITAKRMFGAKTVSAETSLTTNFTNDRLPPAINSVKFYTAASNGTAEATTLNEGGDYTVKVEIARPETGMLVVVGNNIATTTDSGTKAGTGRFNFADNRKVVMVQGQETRGNVSTGLIPISLPYDRKTNPAGLLLELVAKLDWSAANSGLTVGSSYVGALTTNNAEQRSLVKTAAIGDISQTMSVSAFASKTSNGASAISFDEGEDIFFNFELTDATIGDQYEVILGTGNAVLANRYSLHPFSSVTKTITAVSGFSLLQYQGTFLKNYFTDGVKSGVVTLRNKTTGANITNITFTLNDTTKTVTLAARWLNQAGNAVTSVNEGDSFKLEVTATDLPLEFPIRIKNATGRTLADFSSHSVDSHAYPANGKVLFGFNLKENFKVDTVNTFGVTAEVVGLPVSLVVPNLIINDTSKSVTYDIKWLDSGGNPITQANEGSNAVLEVIARGVPSGAGLSVTLSGAGINTSDMFDGVLTKTATFQNLSTTGNVFARVNWNIANDQLTEGNETVTATVRIDGVQVGTANLVIVDTSLTPPVYSAYITSDAAGNNRITTANEGDVVYAVVEAANVVTEFNASWNVYGDTAGSNGEGTWAPFDPMSGNVTIRNGKNIVRLQIPINYITTTEMVSSIGFGIPGLVNNLLTPYLTIKDTYKTPSFTGLVWSRNVEGTDPVSTLNPGEEIYLVVLTRNIHPDQRFEISIPLMDGTTLADWAYGPWEGTVMSGITQYDAATGLGRRATAFKLR